ncbi:MAG: DUF6133 family protein [Lachnospiraceae bacterium]
MKKITNFTNKMAVVAMVKGAEIKEKALNVFAQKEGEGFVDTALKILISVVVGALLLAGLYLLFEDTILPTLTQRIEELFDYNG